MRGCELHAPAHVDAEVLSALGRLHRAGEVPAEAVEAGLRELASAPIVRHHLAELLDGAWQARDRLRLVDALYVELAEKLGASVLSTDTRLAKASSRTDLVTLT
jgi:predicted nucleic acid-binding protein